MCLHNSAPKYNNNSNVTNYVPFVREEEAMYLRLWLLCKGEEDKCTTLWLL